LITSMNHPCLHFEMNEAWILDEQTVEKPEEEITKSSAGAISNVRPYEERYPDGRLRISYEGGVADDGRCLLHGAERWYHEDGSVQREATYSLGRRKGTETFLAKNGGKIWTWEYGENGKDIWTRWWPDGGKKSRTTWKHFHAEGPAVLWDRSGAEISNREFMKGKLI
jgi:antitoxin component YwqK of YwqJK toxin-antitoxin module